jgi:hypothetical protein
MRKEIESLKSGLKAAIEAYLIAFEEKYDGEFDHEEGRYLLEPRWFGDYAFSLDDIIIDVENPEQSGEIFKWCGACVDNDSSEINFRSWIMGARFK